MTAMFDRETAEYMIMNIIGAILLVVPQPCAHLYPSKAAQLHQQEGSLAIPVALPP